MPRPSCDQPTHHPLPRPASVGELLTPAVSPHAAGTLTGERGLLPRQRQGDYLIPMLCCRSQPAPGTQDDGAAATTGMGPPGTLPSVQGRRRGLIPGRGTWGRSPHRARCACPRRSEVSSASSLLGARGWPERSTLISSFPTVVLSLTKGMGRLVGCFPTPFPGGDPPRAPAGARRGQRGHLASRRWSDTTALGSTCRGPPPPSPAPGCSPTRSRCPQPLPS